MLCINDQHIDPYFNLAAEEYVLKNITDEVFMLWRNEPAIIVGKFQNTLAEINLDFVQQNNIKVVRRQTGGGAVFHDLGNLNFTFVDNSTSGNFRTFTQPILDVLQTMGIDARFEGRNDLTIDGKKFSGNAQCVHNNRMLHHGTLLFSATMSNLSAALQANPLKFEDKAVKSIRSRVTNISEHLKDDMTVLEFRRLVMQHIVQSIPNCQPYEYTPYDIEQIQRLRDEKYSTWDWNFGSSPRYTFSKLVRTTGGNVEVHLSTANGCISELKIYGDFFFIKDIGELEAALTGCKHEPATIQSALENLPLDDYVRNTVSEELIQAFF